MKYSSIHVHSRYSDGKGEPRDFAAMAWKKGMEVLGFSDHVPVPLENDWSMALADLDGYVIELSRLKNQADTSIRVYLGLEIDYISGIDIWEYARIDSLPLDFFLGAVHYIRAPLTGQYVSADPDSVEFARVVEEGFGGDAEALFRTYYRDVKDMIAVYRPPVAAHLDLVKKNNSGGKYFNEESPGYLKEVEAVLLEAGKQGCLIEINTGGMARGMIREPYPSAVILGMCREMGLGITVNSDAHSPGALTHSYAEAFALARRMGYRTHHLLLEGRWEERPLDLSAL